MKKSNGFVCRLGGVLAACLCVWGSAVQAEPLDQAKEAMADGRYGVALTHLIVAADQGDVDAQRTAGLMLLYGEQVYGAEVIRDVARAKVLLSRAAANGCEVSKHAHSRLGKASDQVGS